MPTMNENRMRGLVIDVFSMSLLLLSCDGDRLNFLQPTVSSRQCNQEWGNIGQTTIPSFRVMVLSEYAPFSGLWVTMTTVCPASFNSRKSAITSSLVFESR